MSGGKKKKKEKTSAPGSTLALIGGVLFFLSLWYTPAFWLPRRPGPPFITADQWTALILTWVVSPFISGVVITICSRLLKSKPKYSVALGATIVVFSLFIPLSHMFASPPASIDSLLYGIPFLLILYPGSILGMIGGLCAIFRRGSKLETAKPSKEDYEGLTKKEYEKLSDKEKHMKEEYERLMEED